MLKKSLLAFLLIVGIVLSMNVSVTAYSVSTLSVTDDSYENGYLGDADQNFSVNIKDATLIQKYVSDLLDISDQQWLLCEINEDNVVNIKDATEIQKWIVGLLPSSDINRMIDLRNAVCYSNVIQEYKGDMYYCSSQEGAPIWQYPRFDFSILGYNKIPVESYGGVQAFAIYDDLIYYISGLKNQVVDNRGVYSVGTLSVCDMNGDNTRVISKNVTSDYFVIRKGKLFFATPSVDGAINNYFYYSYNLKTSDLETCKGNDSVFFNNPNKLFKYNNEVEYCGGYYYYSFGDIIEIDGASANVFYYRRDAVSGDVVLVGYSFQLR